MNIDKVCRNCRFSRPAPPMVAPEGHFIIEEQKSLACRRYPQTFIVDPEEWCGEFCATGEVYQEAMRQYQKELDKAME